MLFSSYLNSFSRQTAVLAFASALFAIVLPASADVISFQLEGNGGGGLLGDNVTPPSGELGTGDIGENGIWFDTDTRDLHIHLVWGSENGHNDVSEDVFLLHLHGPTDDPAPDSFSQTGPLIVALSNSITFDDSPTGGSVDDFWRIDADDVDALLDGRTYINVHLNAGDGGMMRGYLVAVPEPSTILPLFLGLTCLIRRSRADFPTATS